MPLRWSISHEHRRVDIAAEGIVVLKDAETCLDAIVVADAMSYAKLFDASDMEVQATDHDVLMLGARLRAYIQTVLLGPAAFVVRTRASREFVDRYLNLAGDATRQVKICRTAEEACQWLDQQK